MSRHLTPSLLGTGDGSTGTGAATDYAVSVSIDDTQTATFSTPSFSASASSTSGGGSGALYAYQVGSYAPNGNILSSNDSVMGTWSYGYDTLNRLTSAQNTGVTSVSAQFANQNGCWTYDAFGNRTLEVFAGATALERAGLVVDCLRVVKN